MTTIVISSGHSRAVRGAHGYLDEVIEARRVVAQLTIELRALGVEVFTFHDNTSATQSENLKAIVAFHNSKNRDLDVSIHFNAHRPTQEPMGTEVLFVNYEVEALAARVAAAISTAGDLIDRGSKHRDNLAFLNNTNRPAILIEVCFVDSMADATLYNENFSVICEAIADALDPDREAET